MSDGRGAPADARCWDDRDGRHLDVRGLVCPQPLVEVLGTIDGGEITSLIVHLDQEPLLLYPQLEERGWTHEILPPDSGQSAGADELRLRIARLHP